jgi:hypothetical protein
MDLIDHVRHVRDDFLSLQPTKTDIAEVAGAAVVAGLTAFGVTRGLRALSQISGTVSRTAETVTKAGDSIVGAGSSVAKTGDTVAETNRTVGHSLDNPASSLEVVDRNRLVPKGEASAAVPGQKTPVLGAESPDKPVSAFDLPRLAIAAESPDAVNFDLVTNDRILRDLLRTPAQEVSESALPGQHTSGAMVGPWRVTDSTIAEFPPSQGQDGVKLAPISDGLRSWLKRNERGLMELHARAQSLDGFKIDPTASTTWVDSDTLVARKVNYSRTDTVIRKDLGVAVEHTWFPIHPDMPHSLRIYDFKMGETTEYELKKDKHRTWGEDYEQRPLRHAYQHTKIFADRSINVSRLDASQMVTDIHGIVADHFSESSTGIPLGPVFEKLDKDQLRIAQQGKT